MPKKPPRVSDPTDPFQREVRTSFEFLGRTDIINGRGFSDIALTSGVAKKVSHGLGRIPKGWIITDMDAAAIVIRSSSTERNKYLTLTASADTTISLWIY
jgi:hypothetical protein